LNANDAVFVTQRTTTVDDEVIYYCRRRRLRRRRFFFVFFFFARRESKEGKEIRIFLSLCYPSSFSLLFFRWQNLILSSRALSASLKNSDLFSSLSFVGIILYNKKQKQQTTLTVIFGRVVYEVRVERLKRNRRWLRGRLEEQPIQTEG
jgi:hypothetical protein